MTDIGVSDFWAVVPAGGVGSRLWPLSRADAPKFLIDVTSSGRSMLQQAWDRLKPVCGERFLVVTGTRYGDAVRRQLPQVPSEQILLEPSPKESMAAIGLAAALLERRDPSIVMGSFPSDHVIPSANALRSCILEAINVARTGRLAIIGITPTYATSGLGYVQFGEPINIDGAPSAHRVVSFKEKPDPDTAKSYVDSGFRWNAGMWICRVSVLLDMLAKYQPVLAGRLRTIAAEPARMGELWEDLTRIVIDDAIAIPGTSDGLVFGVPGDFAWDDVGDYSALASTLPPHPDNPNLGVLGEASSVVALDATGLVAPRSGRTIAIAGVEDIVVVDTDDVLLVTSIQHAQGVKAIVDTLRIRARDDLA